MPYISPLDKQLIDSERIEPLLKGLSPLTTGQLNYLITRIILNYLGAKENYNYGRLSAVSGVLHDVQTEFDRRVMAEYENKKMKENGDVY